MGNIVLVIIFNHRFDKNISILKKLYSNRFSKIKFLVPFYEGNDPDVIQVYESSYQFQGYITQAYDKLKNIKCDHFIFIGDDLILNPNLNERNILENLGVGKEDGYIESLTRLKDTTYWHYNRFMDACNAFKTKAVNYQKELPPIELAIKKADSYGLHECLIDKELKCTRYRLKEWKMNVCDIFNKIFNPVKIDYPLVTAYSDFFVIPQSKLKEFARISGIFSAMRLFVEIAIPTTLMLILEKDKLKTQNNSKMLTPKLWWVTDTAINFEKKCKFITENMEKNWPDNYVYLHPIKLSKWT